MDRWQALYKFWSSFGVPAYEENSVPEDATMPYIAYESAVAPFNTDVSLSASIWDRTTKGTAFIDGKADEIESYIRNMKECPRIKGGRYRVFIPEGIEFARTRDDPEDRLIKRKILNVNFEFMTNN